MPHKDPEKRKAYARERMRKWRSNPDNVAKVKAKRKVDYAENKNGLRDKMLKNYQDNREERLKQSTEYRKKNPEVAKKSRDKMKGKNLDRNRKARNELQDHYVVTLLTENSKLMPADVRENKELIDLKRLQLKLKRSLNEAKGNSRAKGNS